MADFVQEEGKGPIKYLPLAGNRGSGELGGTKGINVYVGPGVQGSQVNEGKTFVVNPNGTNPLILP